MKVSTKMFAGPALLLFSAVAGAQSVPAKEVMLDIDALPIVEALHGWARQTGMQLLVMVPGDLKESQLVAPAVKGTFTSQAALEYLLSGTHLTYEIVNDHTVVIRGDGQQPTRAIERVDQREDKKLLRLALVQDEATSRPSGGATYEKQRDVEEVIVSAQRREEKLQDVPISISVLGGVDLDRATDRGIADALNRVPGVVNLSYGGFERFGGNSSVAVRGVTTIDGTSSPTAYYLDSIPFGFIRHNLAPDSSAYDLERVEVLRGPQGTLYGSSALNGVVRVLTRDANLNDFEFKVRTSAAGTENGDETYRGDVAANVPIVDGKLAARLVLGYQDIGGWIDKPNQKDANSREVQNARVKINAQPTDKLSLELFAWLSRTDIDAPSYSPDGLHSPLEVPEPAANDYDAFGFNVGYDFAKFSLSSMTSYIDFTADNVLDISAFAGPGISLATRFASKVFAQEINLSSHIDGPWRWTMGGIYRDVEDTDWQLRSTGYVAPKDESTTSESFAVFGELTRVLLDGRVELTGGLRYFEDRIQDVERSSSDGVPVGGYAVTPTNKFHDLAPRAVVTWHPSDRLSLYGSYAEGFRSGLNQLPTVTRVAPEFPPADPDELKNYEVGVKGNVWDGRIAFDSAVYFIDWQGVQQSFTVLVRPPNVFEGALVNAGSVSGVGVELGLSIEPLDGLTLSTSVNWNDLEVDEDVFNDQGGLVFAQGDRLAGSAETTASLSADYAFPLGASDLSARFSTGAEYVSDLIVGRTSAGPALRASTVVVRASLGVDAGKGWSASLFAENLGNEKGLARDPFVPEWNTYLRPRTIGLQFEYQFN